MVLGDLGYVDVCILSVVSPGVARAWWGPERFQYVFIDVEKKSKEQKLDKERTKGVDLRHAGKHYSDPVSGESLEAARKAIQVENSFMHIQKAPQSQDIHIATFMGRKLKFVRMYAILRSFMCIYVLRVSDTPRRRCSLRNI